MNEKPPRRIAYEVLQKLEAQRGNSTILLQDALSRVGDERDRGLVTDLVLGVVRRRSRLLHLISVFSRKPPDRLDPEVALILQLGIYQLVYTDIPQHAAIYETVQLAKKGGFLSAASFVNGVLRGIQGKLAELPPAPDLAVRHSHPEWLVRRWVHRFGEEEASRLMETNNTPSPVYLRRNPLMPGGETLVADLEREGVTVEEVPGWIAVLRVSSGTAQLTDAFLGGRFYIQDLGVEALGLVMDPVPGDRVLEIAAAPGGKTFQLALRMQNRGAIVSTDAVYARLKTWRRNVVRLGIACAHPVAADAVHLPLLGEFDLVVVDAPCTSLGVIRRHPEIRWWRNQEDLQRMGGLQLQILDACAKYVRVGGRLVYSVCSFEPEETEDVVERFLLRSGLEMVSQKYLFPHRDGADGFFVAALKRT